jgi:hypothetical protein
MQSDHSLVVDVRIEIDEDLNAVEGECNVYQHGNGSGSGSGSGNDDATVDDTIAMSTCAIRQWNSYEQCHIVISIIYGVAGLYLIGYCAFRHQGWVPSMEPVLALVLLSAIESGIALFFLIIDIWHHWMSSIFKLYTCIVQIAAFGLVREILQRSNVYWVFYIFLVCATFVRAIHVLEQLKKLTREQFNVERSMFTFLHTVVVSVFAISTYFE